MVKDLVRLNPEEHAPWLALVHTGGAAAVKRLHARILRKAAVGAGSRRWTETAIADALDTRLADQLVALDIVDTIRPAWVRPTRKNTRANHGSSSHG